MLIRGMLTVRCSGSGSGSGGDGDGDEGRWLMLCCCTGVRYGMAQVICSPDISY
jgi:hypothetical protein